ncbi:receptor-type tyrosine-protein phosphatase R-like [Ictidomys tridecemlineatus]
MDVNKLNITLLRIFRQGVAAALGLLPQQVHINRLIEKKNSVELFVSPINRKAGISDALPSEEVSRSLNINVLHQSLSQFGITEVSPEKNVLQGQHEADRIWSKEGFYAVVIFLSIFIIIVTCLMVSWLLCILFPLLSPLLNVIGCTAIQMKVEKTGQRSKTVILLFGNIR